MGHYSNVRSRASRLVLDIDKILKRVDDLEEACRKLRNNEETYILAAEARERVLKSLLSRYEVEPIENSN